MAPLTELLRGPKTCKNPKIPWTEKKQGAYDNTISALAQATRLNNEETNLPLVLSTDASEKFVGAVLEQPDSEPLNGQLPQ